MPSNYLSNARRQALSFYPLIFHQEIFYFTLWRYYNFFYCRLLTYFFLSFGTRQVLYVIAVKFHLLTKAVADHCIADVVSLAWGLVKVQQWGRHIKPIISFVSAKGEEATRRDVACEELYTERRGDVRRPRELRIVLSSIILDDLISKYLGYRFVAPIEAPTDLSLDSRWPALISACTRMSRRGIET